MSAEPFVRVLCVDDHHLVRDGLVLIINHEPDLTVVATAATGEQAVALYRQHRPDVTIMDLRLSGMSGLGAIHAIRADDPHARIVVVTMHDDDEDLYQALAAGAAAYLLKSTVSEDLIRVIREVYAGLRLSSATIDARLAARAARPQLTPRELEVIGLMADAMRSREIAAVLNVTEQTVKVHVRNIFGKLNVADRVAAINVARRLGLIRTP